MTGSQIQKYMRDLPLIASTISVSVDQGSKTDSSSAFEIECRALPQNCACISCLIALHLRSHKRFIHPRPQPCSLSQSRPALWCPGHLGHPLSSERQRVSTNCPPSRAWRSPPANNLRFIYAALSGDFPFCMPCDLKEASECAGTPLLHLLRWWVSWPPVRCPCISCRVAL